MKKLTRLEAILTTKEIWKRIAKTGEKDYIQIVKLAHKYGLITFRNSCPLCELYYYVIAQAQCCLKCPNKMLGELSCNNTNSWYHSFMIASLVERKKIAKEIALPLLNRMEKAARRKK